MSSIRLLIVDDHPVVRTGLRGMFETDPGFAVVGEAADGAQAVEQVRTTRPDLVLMDLQMPVLDGVAAIVRIRQLPNPPPVLVLTTYDSDNQILRAVEAGAAGYLLKDAPRETLFAAVRSAVAGARPWPLPWRHASCTAWGLLRRPEARLCLVASSRWWHWSPGVRPTRKSPTSCASARRPSRPTSPISSRSSA